MDDITLKESSEAVGDLPIDRAIIMTPLIR